MKTMVAAASNAHASAMSTLLIVISSCFAPRTRQKLGGNRGPRSSGKRGLIPPPPHNHPNENNRQQRHDDRCDPSGNVEPLRGRNDEHCWPVFLYERLQRQVVRFIAGHTLVDFALHALCGFARTREGAAGMITRGRGIITAAAHAFHALSELSTPFSLLRVQCGRNHDTVQNEGQRRERQQKEPNARPQISVLRRGAPNHFLRLFAQSLRPETLSPAAYLPKPVQ